MEHHVFTLHGSDEARCGGQSVKGGKGGPIGRLARKIESEGAADLPVKVLRDGKPVFASDRPLSWWCMRQTSEGQSGPRIGYWQPNPLFSEAAQ